MLSKEQKLQLNEILEELGVQLDISESQYKVIETSYESVGEWLARDNSPLAKYKPVIKPQGSILSGTAILPIHENDDIDIDLVCEFHGKNPEWTQFDLKHIVGNQLEEYAKQNGVTLDKEKKRCWSLLYNRNSDTNRKYHMDILPSVITEGYEYVLESIVKSKTFSQVEYNKLAISITDNTLLPDYFIQKDHILWPISNPFGYGDWLKRRSKIMLQKSFSSVNESVEEIPSYNAKKYPLQRVIQLLKRHRDIMFEGDDDKPISIIIATLAAHAYEGESDIYEAFNGIIKRLELGIKTSENGIDFEILNPVNPLENFADKWKEVPNKRDNFFHWMKELKSLIHSIEQDPIKTYDDILSKSFGEKSYQKALIEMGNKYKVKTDMGINRFSSSLGLTAIGSNILNPHNFHGK